MVKVLAIDGLLRVSLLQDSPLLDDVVIAFLCLGSGRESERDSYTVNYLFLTPGKDTLCDFFGSQRN